MLMVKLPAMSLRLPVCFSAIKECGCCACHALVAMIFSSNHSGRSWCPGTHKSQLCLLCIQVTSIRVHGATSNLFCGSVQLLTTDSFEAAHHKHDVMIVNFFAPWCHWCQKVCCIHVAPLPFEGSLSARMASAPSLDMWLRTADVATWFDRGWESVDWARASLRAVRAHSHDGENSCTVLGT
jgi:hypothetical protein